MASIPYSHGAQDALYKLGMGPGMENVLKRVVMPAGIGAAGGAALGAGADYALDNGEHAGGAALLGASLGGLAGLGYGSMDENTLKAIAQKHLQKKQNVLDMARQGPPQPKLPDVNSALLGRLQEMEMRGASNVPPKTAGMLTGAQMADWGKHLAGGAAGGATVGAGIGMGSEFLRDPENRDFGRGALYGGAIGGFGGLGSANEMWAKKMDGLAAQKGKDELMAHIRNMPNMKNLDDSVRGQLDAWEAVPPPRDTEFNALMSKLSPDAAPVPGGSLPKDAASPEHISASHAPGNKK